MEVFFVEMTACNVCGKIFGTSGRAVCPSCRKLLDIVYEKARAYLRDHPKEELSYQELAKKIGEDLRLVEILVAEGRFDNKGETSLNAEDDRKRRKLLEDLQRNLSGTSSQRGPGSSTYAKDRHGRD